MAELDPLTDPKAPELMEAIPHLLTVIRNIADRSEFVKQLVCGLTGSRSTADIRRSTSKQSTGSCGVTVRTSSIRLTLPHSEGLSLVVPTSSSVETLTDFPSYSEYRPAGQDAAEYDFRDFRSAKLERLRRDARSSTNAAHDEALLEYMVGGETATPSAATSPRLDAMYVHNALTRPSATQPLPSIPSNAVDLPEVQGIDGDGLTQTSQPWWGLTEPEKADEVFSLDWSWLLDESGHPGYQTGDPTTFWSQLQQT